MSIDTANQKRSATIFPKNQKVLEQLGENIKLARKRRNYTQTLISERTGLSRMSIRKIESGDGTVSLGHYVSVLGVLGLVEDLANVANDDNLGRKLQDIKLMSREIHVFADWEEFAQPSLVGSKLP